MMVEFLKKQARSIRGDRSYGTPEHRACCVSMMTGSKPLNGRTSKTAKELEAALHKALQAHPECHGIRILKLTLLENSQGIANWDAEFSTPPGTVISADHKRVLIGVKQAVQKHFDLAGSG
jgi:hypothetical protein